MMLAAGIITLLILAVLSMNLRRIYGQAPLKELKRRANKGDQTAQGLYLVAHHGVTADRFLLGLTVLSAATAVVMTSQAVDMIWALIFVLSLVSLLFVPFHHQKARPVHLFAQKLAPYLGQMLGRFRPTIQRLGRKIKRHGPAAIHTGLYEKEDLATLVEAQKVAVNNRIDQAELDIVLHALIFGEKKVKDHMTPRREIRFVSRDEPIGPVLMSELHDSGFSRFPVMGKSENEIVGTLYLKDLVERMKSGLVSNVMSPKVYFVSDEAPLKQVLDAFIKTKHHLFMVVNETEEIVGLISIEDVLEQILGHKISDEFDKYDDLQAVAKIYAREAAPKPKKRKS